MSAGGGTGTGGAGASAAANRSAEAASSARPAKPGKRKDAFMGKVKVRAARPELLPPALEDDVRFTLTENNKQAGG